MAKDKLPVYSICTIKGNDNSPEEFMVSRFGEYLSKRGYLFQPHGHSFYHLVFFTKGAGKQSIDFSNFPVKPGQVYFMNPGQVHNWQFKGETDGYIINFSNDFFDDLISGPSYLDDFNFFSGHYEDQVIQLSPSTQETVKELFEKIISESETKKNRSADMIRTLLIQLFIIVSRETEAGAGHKKPKQGYLVLKNFQKLVNEHFLTHKLPSEFAGMLYVTPNYLNALSKDLLGKSAGEVIRERIILEAKRMLVNADLSISGIAWHLNFQDNSYFTKFFKKYAGKTPEEFRKEYHIGLTT